MQRIRTLTCFADLEMIEACQAKESILKWRFPFYCWLSLGIAGGRCVTSRRVSLEIQHYSPPRIPMKTTILAFLISASLALAGDPISFKELPIGDSIHVTFTSTGCFHFETYEFDFRRSATMSVQVTQVELRWNEAQERHEEVKRIPLGTVTLSDGEVAGLDRLFTFYRSIIRRAGCTTVDHITAARKSGGAVQATESFTDATCATGDRKNLTLLASIITKATPKEK